VNGVTEPVREGAFDDLRDLVAKVSERFTAAGHRLYLVGGVVRDVWLDLAHTGDLDLTTDATPDVVRNLVEGVADAVWLQGERFGTVGIRVGDLIMEITTHRAESYVGDSRKPVVSFSSDLHEDLGRRDFTVNAMAVDVVDGQLHDPFDGRADLAAGILRTPLSPEESFGDDPLRMLRAARFHAGYDLTPADGLIEAARTLADRIGIVSGERVRGELFRLLEVADPTGGFAFLEAVDLGWRVLPELAGLDGDARSTALVRVAATTPDPVLRLAVIAWSTAGLAESTVALRLSGSDAVRITGLVDGADRIRTGGAAEEPWSDESARRLAAASGLILDPVVDFAGSVGILVGDLPVALGRLRADGDLDDLGPALDGDEVMALLGLEAGREVGEALAWLSELRLGEGRMESSEAAGRLVAWWATRASG
jgi:poly(A) polymerase